MKTSLAKARCGVGVGEANSGCRNACRENTLPLTQQYLPSSIIIFKSAAASGIWRSLGYGEDRNQPRAFSIPQVLMTAACLHAFPGREDGFYSCAQLLPENPGP